MAQRHHRSPTHRSNKDRRCSRWRWACVSCASGGTISTNPSKSSNATRFPTPSPTITGIMSITPSVRPLILRIFVLSLNLNELVNNWGFGFKDWLRLDEWAKLDQFDLNLVEAVLDEKVEEKIMIIFSPNCTTTLFESMLKEVQLT
ncbi:hypothetical protein JHK85_004689 [Glycine max]|nr:hypothetical protein JHK85_004689 [Glycine max]KAG5080446.1 hypothetical protein JHK86_004511 [Glycine max]